jgi:hypothetical protein
MTIPVAEPYEHPRIKDHEEKHYEYQSFINQPAEYARESTVRIVVGLTTGL